MIVTGILVADNAVNHDPVGTLYGTNEEANAGAVLFLVGGVASLTSIPFFIASGSNKRKALSVSFKNELVPQLKKNTLVRLPIPSIKLVVKL